MLTIIHGSDTTQSRKYFLDEKNKVKDAILLEADQINLTDLAQIFQGGGLFNETKNLFVEQFLTKRKKSADYKEIITYFETHAKENTIFLWEGKELERNTLNDWKKAVVKIFKLPQTLFQLLDAIQPGNSRQLIKLFHQTIETTETEMVFFMLVRQFRMLLALSNQESFQDIKMVKHSPDNNPIDELKRLAPWQKTKLEKQAQSFDSKYLIKLYDQLFTIEVGQKTGRLTSSLVSSIDFFLFDV